MKLDSNDPLQVIKSWAVEDGDHMAKYLRLFEKEKCICVESGVEKRVKMKDISMSELDLTLWRFDKKIYSQRNKPTEQFRAVFGNKWALIFTKMSALWPAEVVASLVSVLGPLTDCCETCFISRLKKVSANAVRWNILKGHGTWSYYADLKVLGGYDCEPNRADVYTEAIEQISDTDGKKITFSKQMELEVKNIIRGFSWKKHSEQVSFSEYMEFRDAWGSQGACSEGKPLKFVVNKKAKKGRKKKEETQSKKFRVSNKFTNCLGMSVEELVKTAVELKPCDIYPFTKADEPARTRAVFGVDSRSYRRQSYVEKCFMRSFNGNKPWTTLGLGPEQRRRLRARLAILNASDTVFAVSLDQSEFDLTQLLSSVTFAMQEIFNECRKHVRPDLLEEFDMIEKAEMHCWKEARAHFRESGKIVDWKRGMPSGMFWTALIDTLLNAAEARAVAKDLGVTLIDDCFQGDDAVLFTNVPTTGEDWARGYGAYGYSVHPEKTWVSNMRYEFLHENHGPEGAWGFPSRMGKTLLWRRPKLSGSWAPKHARDAEFSDALLSGHRRGLVNCVETAKRLLGERVGGKKTNKKERMLWNAVFTPRAVGGLGFGSKGRTRVNVTVKGKRSVIDRMRIVTQVDGRSPDWISAIKRRLVDTVPCKGIVATTTLETIKTESKTMRCPKGFAKKSHALRLQWTLSDVNIRKDAWKKKLTLEAKLGNRLLPKIVGDDVLDERIRNSPLGVDRAARLAESISSLAADLSSEATTAEAFSSWAERIAKGWSLYVARVIGGIEKLMHRKCISRGIIEFALSSIASAASKGRVAV
uniref:RdRp n=1 Tax=viral metagenome TaxID=1070528 RepID=A0A2V0RBI7_9ZZZZ